MIKLHGLLEMSPMMNIYNSGNGYSFLANLVKDMAVTKGDATPSFSRDTTATVTDFEGVIQNALIDELRFPGLRRVYNMFDNSQDITQWGLSGVSAELSDEYYGSIQSTLVTADGLLGFHRPSQTGNFVEGETYTVTMCCKAGTQSIIKVYGSLAVGKPTVTFDMSTLDVGTVYGTATDCTITSLYDDWVLCRMTFIASTSGDGSIYVYHVESIDAPLTPAKNSLATSYYIAYVQLVKSSEIEDYVSTDILSWPYHGAGVDGVKYLTTDREGGALTSSGSAHEAEATNKFLNSDTPVTQTITVVSGSEYTISCTGTGTVTMSGAGTGTASEGTDVTITASTTSLVCTVDTLDTVQVEFGPAATSYIPTAETIVTRTADVLSYDVTNVTTLGQGSIYCECTVKQSSTYYRVLTLSDGSNTNRVSIYFGSSGYLACTCVNGGSNFLSMETTVNNTDYDVYKLMLTYEENNTRLYCNGVLLITDLFGSITNALTKLDVGTGSTGLKPMTGTIKDVRYYSEALTQTKAAAVTL